MSNQDLRLERSLLGAIVFNAEARLQIAYSLDTGDFTYLPHAQIFASMKGLLHREIVPSIDHLLFDLQERKQSEAFGLIPELYDEFLPLSFVEESIRRLKQLTFLRSIAMQCSRGLELVKAQDALKLLDQWNNDLRKLFYSTQAKTARNLNDILQHAYQNPDRSFLQDIQLKQEQYRTKQEVFTGYPTHYRDLDKLFNGFQKGHLTIIGARPGVGKTSFMLNLALHQIFINKIPVGIFSLEMPALSIAEKMVFIHARIDYRSAKKGMVAAPQFQALYGAVNAFKSHPIVQIDDSAKIDVYTLGNRIRHWVDTTNIEIVFVDYLQLISAADRSRSKYEQITEISQQLKVLAKDANIALVCLAQLNRNAVAGKEVTKPKVSDLRDSGSIEQDADEIFLLHCPSMDDPHNKPGVLMLNVGKNRFGETGDIELHFQKSTGFIGDLAPIETLNRFEKDEPFELG